MGRTEIYRCIDKGEGGEFNPLVDGKSLVNGGREEGDLSVWVGGGSRKDSIV